jgi:tetratricopeptide (TPR) repeat protein
MRWHLYLLAAAGALLSGCAAIPGSEPMPGSPAPSSPQTPAAARSARSPIDTLEHLHRERAKTFDSERNWADALVEWDLLTLLKPDSQEYREAVAATRTRIRTATAGLLRAAEFARKQGNLDQATLLYLRALNLDRGDASAAQALREIEIERAQRTYFNRPPRGNYP